MNISLFIHLNVDSDIFYSSKKTPITYLQSPVVDPTGPEAASPPQQDAAPPPAAATVEVSAAPASSPSVGNINEDLFPEPPQPTFPALDNFFAAEIPAEPAVDEAPTIPAAAVSEQELINGELENQSAVDAAAAAAVAAEAVGAAAPEDVAVDAAAIAAAADAASAEAAAFDFQQEIAKLAPSPAELVPGEDFIQDADPAAELVPSLETTNQASPPPEEQPISVLVPEAATGSLSPEEEIVSVLLSEAGLSNEVIPDQLQPTNDMAPPSSPANEVIPEVFQPATDVVPESTSADKINEQDLRGAFAPEAAEVSNTEAVPLQDEDASSPVETNEEPASEGPVSVQTSPEDSASFVAAQDTTVNAEESLTGLLSADDEVDQLIAANGLSTSELLKSARLRLEQLEAKERGLDIFVTKFNIPQ
jgi:hypothetical protein